jgi:hypothetical protein
VDLFENSPQPSAERIAFIKDLVSRRFELPPEAVVIVSELRCAEPGCPPLETVIAILDGPGRRRQVKLHKAITEITANDVDGLILAP